MKGQYRIHFVKLHHIYALNDTDDCWRYYVDSVLSSEKITFHTLAEAFSYCLENGDCRPHLKLNSDLAA